MITWSGELRTMASHDDVKSLGAAYTRRLTNAADEIDRTRDALWELLKLFTEIDGGRHARHTAVIEARAALGLPSGTRAAGQAGAASGDFKSTDGRAENGGGSNATEGAARG